MSDIFDDIMNDRPGGPEDRTVQVAGPAAKTGYFGQIVDGLARGIHTVDDFVRGAADTVTSGYADEFAAKMESLTGIGGEAGDYQANLDRERKRDAEGGAARFAGQLGGALAVPFGAEVKSAKGLALLGGIEGGLYASGSADGDLSDRIAAVPEGLLWGAAGGYVIGKALPFLGEIASKVMPIRLSAARRDLQATQRSSEEILTAEDRAALEALPDAPAGPAPDTAIHVTITPEAKAAVHEGELLTPKELTGDPEVARKLAEERLATIPPERLGEISSRVVKAMESGEVVDDPFFRSLLHIDTTEIADDPNKLRQVLGVFDDTLDDMLTKAGAGHRTVEEMQGEFRAALARGVTMDDLYRNAVNSSQLFAQTRIGTHAMAVAGNEFVKAREALLPKLLSGAEGAREALTDQLVRSAQIYAYGRAPISNAGRAMRFAQEDAAVGLTKVEFPKEIEEPGNVAKRVREAVQDLSDDEVADLLGRVRTTDDLGRVNDIITDRYAAKQFSTLRKSLITVSKFLKSNALSPATALYNAASVVLHDAFRNELGRWQAIRNAMRLGDTESAELFRLEQDVGRSVYWEAHKIGIAKMIDRIRWEFWTDVERVASTGFGSGRVTAAARKARTDLLENGFVESGTREQPDHTLMAMTQGSLDDYNAKLAARVEDGGAFARVLNAAERAGTSGMNLIEALGTASGKLFIGAFDDWGREFVRVKELHVQSARYAFREGVADGLEGDALAEFVKNRAKELADLPTPDLLGKIEQSLLSGTDLDAESAFLLNRDRLTQAEADRVLFMDGPQTAFGQRSAELLSRDPGFIFPFVKTPIRIFETGLVDYTPAGKFAKHVRDVIEAGGPEAELMKARMEVGTMAIGIGFALGAAGVLVVTNGGFNNTANLEDGPPNRLKIGSAYTEIGRLDPFSLTLALGGFLGQAMKEGFSVGLP